MKRKQTPRRRAQVKRRRQCPFTAAGMKEIDYKDVETLKRFLTERGKILPRRVTSVSAKHQPMLANAVKRARHMGLLPFVAND
jgi:small subunit ribosomal protein S18